VSVTRQALRLAAADGATLAAVDEPAVEGDTEEAVLGAVEADDPEQADRMMAVVAPRAISRRESCNAVLLLRSRTPLGCGPGQGRRVREIGTHGSRDGPRRHRGWTPLLVPAAWKEAGDGT
jgi:hypothetical protein